MPFAPLVIPKNCVELFDVYVINSFAIAIVPADGKSVVESTVTAVPDPPDQQCLRSTIHLVLFVQHQ